MPNAHKTFSHIRAVLGGDGEESVAREGDRDAELPPATAYARWSRKLFYAAAGVSFVFSVSLWVAGHSQEAIFVGIWVPSILSLGGLVLSDRPR
jgi:hypothetical protein